MKSNQIAIGMRVLYPIKRGVRGLGTVVRQTRDDRRRYLFLVQTVDDAGESVELPFKSAQLLPAPAERPV